jgi:hypothetical protein
MQAPKYQMRGFASEGTARVGLAAEATRFGQHAYQATERAARPSAVGVRIVANQVLQVHPRRSRLSASRVHRSNAAANPAGGFVSTVPSLGARQRWPISSSLSGTRITRAPVRPPNSGFAVIAQSTPASGYFSYVCTAPVA